MPTNKEAREAAKQKRSKANRAQREALAARSEAAKRPSREAPTSGKGSSASSKASSKGSSSRATASAKSGTARERPARRPRMGDEPVDVTQLEGGHVRKVLQVPGGSQVVTALVLAIVGSAFLLPQKIFAPEGAPKDYKGKATRSLIDVAGLPLAIVIVAVPCLIVALGVIFGLHRQRRRIWLATAVFLGLLVMQSFIFYIFPLGMIGYGLYRAYKVEGPNEPLFGRRRARVDDDEVIDVDAEEVDDELDDDLPDDVDDDVAQGDDGGSKR